MKRLVIGRGSVFADLLIIGEAPGAQEDLEGKPYVGKSGKLLNELLIKAGIDYKEDVYFCNVIKCRPSNIAILVASITSFGASKSGSPALKLQISTPSADNWFALALICNVREGSIESALSDKLTLLIDL